MIYIKQFVIYTVSIGIQVADVLKKSYYGLMKRKMKRADSVLWQKSLQQPNLAHIPTKNRTFISTVRISDIENIGQFEISFIIFKDSFEPQWNKLMLQLIVYSCHDWPDLQEDIQMKYIYKDGN